MATCFVAVLGLLGHVPQYAPSPPSACASHLTLQKQFYPFDRVRYKRRTPRIPGAFFFYYGFMLSLPEKVFLLPAAQNGIDKCRDWAAGKPI